MQLPSFRPSQPGPTGPPLTMGGELKLRCESVTCLFSQPSMADIQNIYQSLVGGDGLLDLPFGSFEKLGAVLVGFLPHLYGGVIERGGKSRRNASEGFGNQCRIERRALQIYGA